MDPEQPQPESFEPQPETLPPDTSAQDDAEIQRLLSNPVLRERVQKEYAQMSTMAEYTRQHYVNAAAQLAQQVQALSLLQFPELSQFANNPAAMAGAVQMLRQENPTRYAELENFANRAAIVTEQAQRAQAEQRAVVQERQQQEFQRYAQAEDAKAFANTSPEELKQIRTYLYEEAKELDFRESRSTSIGATTLRFEMLPSASFWPTVSVTEWPSRASRRIATIPSPRFSGLAWLRTARASMRAISRQRRRGSIYRAARKASKEFGMRRLG